jgi:hypothetical protein
MISKATPVLWSHGNAVMQFAKVTGLSCIKYTYFFDCGLTAKSPAGVAAKISSSLHVLLVATPFILLLLPHA